VNAPADNVFQAATLTPTEVLAGDSAAFVVRLTVGPAYTDGPSRLVFDLPGTVGMSRPTRMHQESDGFVTVRVSNPHVPYRERVWDMEIADFVTKTRHSWRGMAARMAVLDLDGGLRAGDTIELRWGATSGGYGPGTKVTTVVPRPDYACTIHVRYFAEPNAALPDFGRSFEGYTRPEPDAEVALAFRVRPRAPHHLRLLRTPDRALLLPHDVFWNVAEVATPATLVDADVQPTQNAFGAFTYRDKHVQVRSRGLPMTETPTMDDVYDGYNLYWGDVHTHTAFSIDCVEREKMDMTPADLMRFARERAGLDFYAPTDHHQPWDIPRHQLGREAWGATLAAVREHHRPGEFVVIPGIEYRGPRGDTVVLFNGLPDYDEIQRPTWTDVRQVWQGLADRDVLTIPHFHNPGRLDEGTWWAPEAGTDVEPVLEIFSCHGSYEREDALEHHIPLIKASRPDRYGAHFLRAGYRYGFVCNSDGHKGHVGSNGLTAVFARSLDRDAIFEAYRQRRVYGTTNARIRLVFTGNGHLMGAVVPNDPVKTLHIDVTGECAPAGAPAGSPEGCLKKVDLFRDAELYRRFTPEGRRFTTDVVVREAAPSSWYVRVTQRDNHIAYSSPIWFA
jgi:hypothetical protein